VSPHRTFGQTDDIMSAPRTADGTMGWASGPWSADPAPATRNARPRALGHGVAGHADDDDPPTDPFGFPPVPVAPGWPAPEPPRRVAVPPDPLAAAALAGAFAADYLSWDEADPARRGRALADHLPATGADPTLLGWDGRGRQRAEFALPGQVVADGDDRVLVDVRVRVTPYRAVSGVEVDGPEAEPEPHVPGLPAAAPAPTGRGWRDCASYWVRLSVPVVRDDDRLAVDAADEAGAPVSGAVAAAPPMPDASDAGLLLAVDRVPESGW
jgi:hypothetical protein